MDLFVNFENFNKVCRICLEFGESLISISLYDIINMIKACATVDIWLNDELPNQICQICLTRLKDSFNFKQLCEKSDNDLRRVIDEYKTKTCKNLLENSDSKNSVDYCDDELFSIKNKLLDSDEDVENKSIDESKNIQCITESETDLPKCDKSKLRKNFRCETCDATFEKALYLGFHMKRIHNAKGTKCSYCSIICYHTAHLKIHEQLHRESVFKCDVCSKMFTNKHKLGRHMYSHSTDRPFHCLQCDYSFKDKWVLKKHVQTMHSDIQKYTACHICGKSVVSTHLHDHILIHGKRQTFTCKLCEKKFLYQLSLERHIKRIHENAARKCTRLCNICGLSMVSAAELKAHMRTHTGEKPYNCDKCDKRYRTKSALKIHNSRAHLDERKHICSVCSRGFYDNKILENHMRTHTGERPFKCQICDKAFSFKVVLKKHMKVHSL